MDHAGEPSAPHWNTILAPYKRPHLGRSIFQLANSALLLAALWAAMLLSLKISYWLTLLLAVPAAGMLIRLFIIQHDCGHGAFFRSARANDIVGSVLGVLTLMPYHYWRRSHAIHHATSGNLDRRELGDIDTLTVEEYLSRSWWGRLRYRLYRNYLVMLILGPIYQFVIKHRFPLDAPRGWKKEWTGILLSNLALVLLFLLAWRTLGLKRFLLVYAPTQTLSGAIGVWLFYVQHQFEETYWRRDREWDFVSAGLEGSSHYDLPRVLHWFTGNIGYHHVHHLSSRIPNYRLRECLEGVPELRQIQPLTIRESLRCARLKLWDERNGRLVGFREARRSAR